MKDIGLQRGIVKLEPHNPRWVFFYEQEATFLRNILSKFVAGIVHIGSTAIPGIVAKPIIDIALAVKSLDNIQEIIKIMESNEYIYRGEILLGIPDRHLFVKGTKDFRTHHIHLMPITHYEWETHQLFRDYLISHPEIAKKYNSLKLDLQQQFPTDRVNYLEGKSSFIRNVIETAKNENKMKNK